MCVDKEFINIFVHIEYIQKQFTDHNFYKVNLLTIIKINKDMCLIYEVRSETT